MQEMFIINYSLFLVAGPLEVEIANIGQVTSHEDRQS